MSSKGIKKGMKVALLGRNSIAWLETFFGIMATGAWAIPLNFRFTDEDIKYCADIAEPALFICDEEFAARVGALCKDLSTVKGYLTIGPTNEPGMENLQDLMQAASPFPSMWR